MRSRAYLESAGSPAKSCRTPVLIGNPSGARPAEVEEVSSDKLVEHSVCDADHATVAFGNRGELVCGVARSRERFMERLVARDPVQAPEPDRDSVPNLQ